MTAAPKKIAFRIHRDEDYRLLPINGVWGGVTPRGDILADFFHEFQSKPDVVTHEVTPEGTVGREVKRTPPNSIQRTILAGMVLSPEQAESIGLWLQAKAREVRELREVPEKGGADSESDTPTAH